MSKDRRRLQGTVVEGVHNEALRRVAKQHGGFLMPRVGVLDAASRRRTTTARSGNHRELVDGEPGVSAESAGRAEGARSADEDVRDMPGAEFFIRVKERTPDAIRIVLGASSDSRMMAGTLRLGGIHKLFVKVRDDRLLRDKVRKVMRRAYRSPSARGRTRKSLWGSRGAGAKAGSVLAT